MKRSTLLILAVGTAVAAFSLARWTHREAISQTDVVAPTVRRASVRISSGHGTGELPAKEIGKYPPACQGLSAKQAALLTSGERMELLAQGALVSDWGNQAALLCGLISGLTRDELIEASKILSGAKQLGNGQPEVVWQSLWQQWGRLDPEAAFVHFGEISSDESNNCGRNVMEGWLETNADRALEWAQQPKASRLEAVAAALAISRNANGDPKQLVTAMLKLPADGATTKACLDDYFDLASLTKESPSAAVIYDQLSPALRPNAWSVAAKRLSLGDPAVAKTWFIEHAADPGHDYSSMSRSIFSQAYEDPAGTVKWVTQLPYDPSRDGPHPAVRAIQAWLQRDPAAATAWLKTQPSDAPWVVRLFHD